MPTSGVCTMTKVPTGITMMRGGESWHDVDFSSFTRHEPRFKTRPYAGLLAHLLPKRLCYAPMLIRNAARGASPFLRQRTPRMLQRRLRCALRRVRSRPRHESSDAHLEGRLPDGGDHASRVALRLLELAASSSVSTYW